MTITMKGAFILEVSLLWALSVRPQLSSSLFISQCFYFDCKAHVNVPCTLLRCRASAQILSLLSNPLSQLDFLLLL